MGVSQKVVAANGAAMVDLGDGAVHVGGDRLDAVVAALRADRERREIEHAEA